MSESDNIFMKRAIAVAQKGMDKNEGGPFGCVIVKDGEIIAEGHNAVTSHNDPTAHAEIVAIREACEKLNTHQLKDCSIYTTCEPCPMCLGAIYWARPKEVFFACNLDDAKKIGFDDQYIYNEMGKAMDQRQLSFKNILRKEAIALFEHWENKTDKEEY